MSHGIGTEKTDPMPSHIPPAKQQKLKSSAAHL
jgi:hypothetical protein